MNVPAAWEGAPCRSGHLCVDPPHEIWWLDIGHPRADPVVVVHGGPGSGSDLETLSLFEPTRDRVVFFDQRGAGRSTPAGMLERNDTPALIADMERLRAHLDIARWTIFAGSWGACLGLVYGQYHPTACSRLILRGLPVRHGPQTRWLLHERPERLPERWATIEALVGPVPRDALIETLYRAVCSGRQDAVDDATRAVLLLEHGLSGPAPGPPPTPGRLAIQPGDIQRARIYLHFWAHRSFLPEDTLLFAPGSLTSTPVTLVHGVSDWICPIEGSETVKRHLPHARLIPVHGAGHSPFHPAMVRALTNALRRT